MTAYATITKQPPKNPISLLIGDALHNMRSALDTLAYALASAFTKPLSEDIANRSDFIFGDEDRKGNVGVGSALFHAGAAKIEGWHPDAQTAVEGLQPYQRGKSFRTDPLWTLHDLDRINKHRLLHITVAQSTGTLWQINGFRNVCAMGPGLIDTFPERVQTDTPISRIWEFTPSIQAARCTWRYTRPCT